jgi:hypothetical protein
MVKALLVNHNTNVTQVAEEHQGSKPELFAFRRRRHGRPVRTSRTTLEIEAYILKGAPHKARTIKLIRPGAIEMIGSAEVRLNGSEQKLI